MPIQNSILERYGSVKRHLWFDLIVYFVRGYEYVKSKTIQPITW